MKFCIYGKNEFPAELDQKFAVLYNGYCRSAATVIDLCKKNTLIPSSLIDILKIAGEAEQPSYDKNLLTGQAKELSDYLDSHLPNFLISYIYTVNIGRDKKAVFWDIKVKANKEDDGNGAKIILAEDILQYGDLIFYGFQKEYFLFRYPKTDDGRTAQEILIDPFYVKIKAEVNKKYRFMYGTKQIDF